MEEFTDLHYAASNGDVSAVKTLLDQGRDLNAFDDVGFTPLHHAANNEHLEVVSLLLSAGADVNAHDEPHIGNNPIGEIAGKCSFEIAKILVDGGADPTIPGWMQLSALDRASERKGDEGQRVYALLCKAAKRFKPA
jgi:ankyrin repeat protein